MEVDIELVDFAEFMADEARKLSRLYFRSSYTQSVKADSSPVTEADQRIEETLRKLVEINFPAHAFYGEEFENNPKESEYTWVVDPIDGTRAFISGRPLFGTLIALCHNNKPVLGIIDQSILNERFLGVNNVTKFNNKIVKTRACAKIEDAIFATTSPFLFDENGKRQVAALSKDAASTIYGGDCYNYAMLASGYLDIVVESGLKLFDFCALVPVITGAGGVITDFGGRELTLGSVGDIIAAGDKAVHSKLLREYF